MNTQLEGLHSRLVLGKGIYTKDKGNCTEIKGNYTRDKGSCLQDKQIMIVCRVLSACLLAVEGNEGVTLGSQHLGLTT